MQHLRGESGELRGGEEGVIEERMVEKLSPPKDSVLDGGLVVRTISNKVSLMWKGRITVTCKKNDGELRQKFEEVSRGAIDVHHLCGVGEALMGC